MVKLCPVVAMILVVVMAAGSKAVAQNTDKALHAALSQAEALDSSLDKLIQPMLGTLLRDAEIEEPLEINRPPQPGTLSVLVVDAQKLTAVRTDHATVKRLLPNLANNVLAIPPATIVFDKAILAALTVNALEDAVHVELAVKALEAQDPRPSPEAIRLEAGKFSALTDLTRYLMIRNNGQNSDPKLSAAMQMPKLVKDLGDDKNIETSVMVLRMMLAPIVLHEIGHLRRGVAGAYQDALAGPLGAATVSLILQEENAADDFAIERMRRVIQKAIAHRPNQQVMMEVQSAIATIKYMRDEVLEDTFGGFRGLNPEDYFIELVHWDCNVRKGTETLALNNPERVRMAMREDVPLLTRAEFDEMRTRIQRRIANGTHSHHFTRGDRFLSAIAHELQERYGVLEEWIDFLNAMVRNDPMQLAPGSTGVSPSTGLSFDEIKRYWLDIDALPAVNCPEGMCAIARFKDHAGFAEVIGPMHDLRRVRIMFQLFGPDFVSRDENPEEYTKYMMLGLRLVSSVMLDKTAEARQAKKKTESLTPAAQLLTKMRVMSRKCGAGAVLAHVGKRSVIMRTLNDRGWVVIDAIPRPPVAQQAGAPKGKRK